MLTGHQASELVKVVLYLEDGELHGECDSFVPEWLDWYMTQCGLADVLLNNWHLGTASLVRELLELGVAPGQPFWIRAEPWSSKTWTDYGWEHDGGVNWEVIHIEPWPPAQVVEAWAHVCDVMLL